MKLENQQIGYWKVVKRATPEGARYPRWRVVCKCGTVRDVLQTELRRGASLSCGCRNRKYSDIKQGDVFTRLTVVKVMPLGTEKIKCVCECGKTSTVLTYHLKSGHTKSCGCLGRENVTKAATKHGLSKRYRAELVTRNYMLNRCYNPKGKQYEDYGGRGITVCKRWRDSFENFFNDMGPKPSKKHSLDRKNTNGNYTPSNCRWATKQEQAQNTRGNKLNKSKVMKIRKLYEQGDSPELIMQKLKLDVHRATIMSVVKRKTWDNIK